MRYPIIFLSALVIEICSTFYIRFVSEGNGNERVFNAVALSLGYIVGTVIVITLIQ